MKFPWKSKSVNVNPPIAIDVKQHGASGFLPDDNVLRSQQSAKANASSYSLKEFPRILERRFGESLGNRTRMLSELVASERLGLGPPDMVHVTLFDKFHKEEIGEYFYITGVDLSSESMPIAFLNILKFDVGETRGSEDSQISTYCCVNIFRKLDIRIRYESDKNYQINAVDCHKGTATVQLSDDLWEETFVSCCLRSLIINTDVVRKLPGLVEYPFAISHGSIMSCQRVISSLCKFLPRLLECGWDTTKSVNPTVLNNYLTEALLIFLSIAPGLTDYALETLRTLIKDDPDNGLYYSIAMLAVMQQSGERELEMISGINEILSPLLPRLDNAPPRDSKSLQLVNCITDLLNLQTEFLINKNDYQLAVSVAKISTELSSDAFNSWYYLAQCYINLEQYDQALIAINCMPHLPDVDVVKHALCYNSTLVGYYKRPLGNTVPRCDLGSNEINILSGTMKNLKETELREIIFGRIVMANESKRGCIQEIWENACMNIGPIYGPHSGNLINFVSTQEVKSIADIKLLARNTVAKQQSWFNEHVCDMLMHITTRIGWNGLLKLRSKLFVMEKEYTSDTQVNVKLSATIPPELRKKRLCERWLDQLFLDLYEDLRISTSLQEHRDVKYSGLEWELIGLVMLRTWNWQDAVACLRTSIMARFDIVSCHKLLQLYLKQDFHHTNALDADVVLELVTQKISYECRFYDSFQILNLQVLYKLSTFLEIDMIRNRVMALPFAERGILAMIETMLEWIKIMTNDKEFEN